MIDENNEYPFYSIIIPFYNVEENLFLECINSIKAQSFNDYEVIVIDDGSIDKYVGMLDDYELGDSRIKVYHIENNGCSHARNYGLSKSSGKYITYVDADDIIHPNMLLNGYKIIKCNSIDIIYGYVHILGDDECAGSGTCKVLSDEMKEKLFKHLIALGEKDFFLRDKSYVSRGPFARIIKRSIAMQNLFAEDMVVGEDMVWNLSLLKKSSLVGICDNIWYYYRKRAGSATHKFRENSINEQILCVERIKKQADRYLDCRKEIATVALDTLINLYRLYFSYKGINDIYVKKLNMVINNTVYDDLLKWNVFYLLNMKDKIKFLIMKSGYALLILHCIRKLLK